MATSLKLTSGKCYEVLRADGERVKFKVMAADKFIIIPSGEILSYTEALGAFQSVKPIE